jgi:hypothetical protein
VRGVPLHGAKARGRVCWVSERSYDLVMAHPWHVKEEWRDGKRVTGPYARTRIGGRLVFMHNLIMGCTGIDHRNGYGLDNTDPNLREATAAQQQHNRGPDDRIMASRFKGVTWDRQQQKWRTRIAARGSRRSLGLFADEAAAGHAYDEAAVELHGEFARLNFPPAGVR